MNQFHIHFLSLNGGSDSVIGHPGQNEKTLRLSLSWQWFDTCRGGAGHLASYKIPVTVCAAVSDSELTINTHTHSWTTLIAFYWPAVDLCSVNMCMMQTLPSYVLIHTKHCKLTSSKRRFFCLPIIFSPGTNICSKDNGGCVQLCLPYPGGRTCECGRGFYRVDATSCAPVPPCRAEEESCHDGSKCISSKKFCDGQLDCPDQSDEQNCEFSYRRTETVKKWCEPNIDIRCLKSLSVKYLRWR